MKKYLVFFLVFALFFAFGCEEAEEVVEEEVDSSEKLEERVLEWVENSPTYKEREGEDAEIIYLVDGEGLVVYETGIAGYGEVDEGDRTAFFAQREREVVVNVDNGEVISAVTDGVYDEVNQDFIKTPDWINLLNVLGEDGEEKIEDYFGEPEEIHTGENPDRAIYDYPKKLRLYVDAGTVDRLDVAFGEFLGIPLEKRYDAELITDNLGVPDLRGNTSEGGEYIAYTHHFEEESIDIVLFETEEDVTIISMYHYWPNE